MKKIMIVSADHLGNAALELTFDDIQNILTVDNILENLPSRQEIAEGVFSLMKPENTWWRGLEPSHHPLFACVDNPILGQYLWKKSQTLNGHIWKPKDVSIPPAKTAEVLYKLDCLLKEDRLKGSNFADHVEMAFASELDPEKIGGHLVRCLGVICDSYFDRVNKTGTRQGVCVWG
jgi:hypothetical protein